MENHSEKKWQFWIDRGGTFTDVMAKTPQGEIKTFKLLSEHPEQYSDAALQGIRQSLHLNTSDPIPVEAIDSVKMGTTVATNALLERQGEPVVLMVTQGFKDVLRIAYQNRPELFALDIQLPKLLYEQVIEVEERIDTHGDVLIPLQLDKAQIALHKAYKNGYHAIAIVLMHGYRFNQHEQQLAECARDIGFQQISVSHQVIPLIKIVSRGDTTVVDAYLSPKLRYYVHQVANSLKKSKLFFMQSNGGLAEAHAFHGKDSILSGPAGGVIGAIKTSEAAGFPNIISFDMGGTSTDVAHYAGELERNTLTTIAGVRLRSPMLRIHTVAAGGGSILKFEQGRYQVGPDSAGANPGPACYRRQGPLTVTDCNVMLGRIQPEFFPKTFGKNASQSLDISIVNKKFKTLAKTIKHDTGDQRSPYQVAAGFLQIAVNNMANAIKKISVQRGYDVTEYTLCCFGGAGGQHACAVADSLGMKTIFIHHHAAVLSAYGLGLAELRFVKEQGIEETLSEKCLPPLETQFDTLTQQASDTMQAQGVEKPEIEYLRKVNLRYYGTDTPLTVDFDSVKHMQADFKQAFQQQFGYVTPERSLTVESISVEAIGHIDTALQAEPEKTAHRPPFTPEKHVNLFVNEAMINAPLYLRQHMRAGDHMKGPTIIIQENSTIIVDIGWQAEIDSQSNLILHRVEALQSQAAIGTEADPVMLEIFNNLLMSIAEQMGDALQKTAYSVNIKERLDFSCAVFDAKGQLVANAPHIPVHLGSMSESVQTVIKLRGNNIHPDDVIMLNNPYNGGTHLPDITVITPIFIDEKQPVFYVASRAHHADIGGITPGSIPPMSKHIEEEGVLIDNFTLVDRGQFCETELLALLTQAKYPVRNPQQNIADLKAQIAANYKGKQELEKMVTHFGIETVQAYMQYIQDNAAECVREVIDHLHDGEFEYAMDNGAKVKVKIQVDRKKREAVIDFTGTSKEQPNNFNAPKAVCYAAVLYVFRTLIGKNIPLNQGCLKPLSIIIPDNCLLNPSYPAAIVAGNVETSQCIVDTLYGALNVMAAAQGTMNNLTFGNDQYQYYETICGGSGAGPGFHGTSAVHTHMTNSLMTDHEVLEHRFPVLIKAFSIREKSGGQGQWHGGDGVVRQLEFLTPMTAAIVANRRNIPPYGLAGGQPAKTGKTWVKRKDGTIEELSSAQQVELNAGDQLIIETPGGGGFG